MSGMSESVAALLNAGVPVDTMGAEANTALHLAAYHGQEGVIAVLMRAGASPTLENMKGSTAVMLAKTDTALTLLCPLHYCAARGMLDNLVAEVAKGRSVNTVGSGGDTPLHAAATTGNTDSTRLLLDRGADPLRRNAGGETPLDVARRHGHGTGGGRVAGGVVGVLEGVTAEAEAAIAKRKAEEAAARSANGGYNEGESVVYMRNGEAHPAIVMKVHQDDEEPYYTVRVHETGRERQTDANHLVRSLPMETPPGVGGSSPDGSSPPPPPPPPCRPDGDGPREGGTTDRSTSGMRVTSRISLKEEVGGGGAGGAGGGGVGAVDPWEAARARLVNLAADLGDPAAAGAAAEPRDSALPSMAQKLGTAFAEMPAAEVRVILERSVAGCGKAGGGGWEPASGSDGLSERGVGGGDAGVSNGEGVAMAVADACRDIVLTCLAGVGGPGRES
ncbi:unnamed protein product [Ectocarpus sp. CCAP 1310/34]|nr:unnamed protein product [Ectocarpus sp. CCAP 1310/34]